MVGGCWRLLSPPGVLDSEHTEGVQDSGVGGGSTEQSQNVKGGGAAWLTTSDLFQAALL